MAKIVNFLLMGRFCPSRKFWAPPSRVAYRDNILFYKIILIINVAKLTIPQLENTKQIYLDFKTVKKK